MKIHSISTNYNTKYDKTAFGNLSIDPKAMKLILRGIRYNLRRDFSLPQTLVQTTKTSGGNILREINGKYLDAMEQVAKVVLEQTQIATKRCNDFNVTIRKGVGDCIKIMTSKDIIPQGDELIHSIILKKPSTYSNAEYISQLVEALHTMNATGNYNHPMVLNALKKIKNKISVRN